jgi:hypothetical protein
VGFLFYKEFIMKFSKHSKRVAFGKIEPKGFFGECWEILDKDSVTCQDLVDLKAVIESEIFNRKALLDGKKV